MNETLPQSVELIRSDKTNINHEYHWFIVPSDDHLPIFSPEQSGDESLQACKTWLENRGYQRQGDTPQSFFEYKREVVKMNEVKEPNVVADNGASISYSDARKMWEAGDLSDWINEHGLPLQIDDQTVNDLEDVEDALRDEQWDE